ncbi:PIN domain-containing protein [Microbacterium sp. NPDC077184]|uniref:PIN domain-containing protein n=1 Tax=Microbacterium sp. NPDC077184 TaxID=3154764 RepID=UPI0034324BBF
MRFPVFLDTSTVFGGALNDLLLTLAERGMFRPLWSAGVFEELKRTLVRRGITADAADRRISMMRAAFPDAEVTGYEELIQAMTCDEGDRHILAAAVRANVELLVTFNLRHFPADALAPYDIEARHPDDFLLDQLELREDVVLTVLRAVLSSYENPPMTVDEYLDLLSRAGVPRFAERTRRYL